MPLGGKVLSVTKVTVPFFNINMYIIDVIGIKYAADVLCIIKLKKPASCLKNV